MHKKIYFYMPLKVRQIKIQAGKKNTDENSSA